MTSIIFGLVYLCVVLFVVGSAVRAVRYARTPIHLRWELYPVPHEDPKRVSHGGSYFEETDWWKQPAHFSLAGEMKVMLKEILFLKGLWESNRPLWWRSYAFHLGLYLLIGTIGLMLAAAALSLAAPSFLAGTFEVALRGLLTALGLAGTLLTILGAVGLLIRRIRDNRMKIYTTPGDIFNLLFFIVALAILAAGYVLGGGDAQPGIDLARGLLSFDTAVTVPPLLAAGICVAALLAAYIPLTHMSHFIGKYFTYHSVRWDDRASARNLAICQNIATYMTYRPTWAARHIGADGKKTWVDLAVASPTQGGPK